VFVHGKLTVITGPMFSGKTETLIKVLANGSRRGGPLAAYKPAVDNRYAVDAIVSHSKKSFIAKALSLEEPRALASEHPARALVGIDEVQFFRPWMVEEILRLLHCDIDVTVSGLDLTYQGQPFGIMPELLCLADEIHKLWAICAKCGLRASRTYRTAPVPAGESVLVGGAEAYEARCLGCFKNA
jgi:thymidine kinase